LKLPFTNYQTIYHLPTTIYPYTNKKNFSIYQLPRERETERKRETEREREKERKIGREEECERVRESGRERDERFLKFYHEIFAILPFTNYQTIYHLSFAIYPFPLPHTKKNH